MSVMKKSYALNLKNNADICTLMFEMKNTLLLFILFFFCSSLYSQTFRVSKNVLSTSLYQPFSSEGGYTISFERMLDPGYSSNAAQFSYKMNATLISSTKKAKYTTINSQVFYDKDAYQFSGYSLLPELRYYFTWDAPMGVYMNLFGNYTSYSRFYTNITVSDDVSEQIKYTNIGRGIGAGFQFKIIENYTLDIIGGYHLQNINSETKRSGSDEFVDDPDEKEERLYFNVHFGINF